MNILQLLIEKATELGQEKVCELLDTPKNMLVQYVSGKKAPGLIICQKIIDLWGVEAPKLVGDGSVCEITTDKNGCIDMTYAPPEWGAKKAAWDGRDVCLCIPCYKPIPGDSFFTFLCLAAKYKQGLRLNVRCKDSMVTRTRNHLAKRFLDTGATWSIWLDTDMVFPIGHAGIHGTVTNMRHLPEKFLGMDTIERLISWNRTMVGGCYWDRNGSGKLIAGGSEPILSPIPSDTLQAVAFVGTGCLAVHRQVFLDIAEKFPDTLHADSLGNECGFFTNIQTPHRMMGEDESFAKRATDAGHPSFLDLGLICGHIGEAICGIPLSGSKI